MSKAPPRRRAGLPRLVVKPRRRPDAGAKASTGSSSFPQAALIGAAAALVGSVIGGVLGPWWQRELNRPHPIEVHNFLTRPVMVRIEGEEGRPIRDAAIIAAGESRRIPVADSPVGVYAKILNPTDESGNPIGDDIQLFLDAREAGSDVHVTADEGGQRVFAVVTNLKQDEPNLLRAFPESSSVMPRSCRYHLERLPASTTLEPPLDTLREALYSGDVKPQVEGVTFFIEDHSPYYWARPDPDVTADCTLSVDGEVHDVDIRGLGGVLAGTSTISDVDLSPFVDLLDPCSGAFVIDGGLIARSEGREPISSPRAACRPDL